MSDSARHRTPDIEALLAVQERLWQAGQRLPVEDLLARSTTTNVDALLELICNEVGLREAVGETPSLTEYQARFPQLADALRIQWDIDKALFSRSFARSTADAKPKSADHVPDVLGRYLVRDILGKGGMGLVYRAWDPLLKRVVVIKVLRSKAADAGDIARFRNEAESIARVPHPHIVPVYDVGDDHGQPYLAMEFCNGGNLAERLHGQPLAPTTSVDVIMQVGDGVAAAHAQKIVHRDLKPANVLLVEPDGPTAHAPLPSTIRYEGSTADNEQELQATPSLVAGTIYKVTDFGLARQTDHVGLTHSGAVMGTPGYMAPEQAFGASKEAGPLADVYSLGAILYECLTGRPPFRGATVADTLDQVRHREPVAIRQLQPQVPIDLETIAHKCLQKNPEARYPSVRALLDDLERFRTGRPILARPLGPIQRAWRWSQRHRAVAVALLIAFVALTAGTITATLFGLNQARTARDLRDRTDELDKQRLAEGAARRLSETRRAQILLDRATASIQRDGDQTTGLLTLGAALEALPEEETERREHVRQHIAWCRMDNARLRGIYDLPASCKQLSVSSDGTIIAARAGTEVLVWDRRQPDAAAKVLHHPSTVLTIHVAPDGTQVATVAGDLLRVWDVAKGQNTFTSEPLPASKQEPFDPNSIVGRSLFSFGEFRIVEFSPDNQAILAVVPRGGVLVWWLKQSKTPVVCKQSDTGLAAHWHPTKKMIVGTEQRCWHPATGDVLAAPPELPKLTFDFRMAPDGRHTLCYLRSLGGIALRTHLEAYNSVGAKILGLPWMEQSLLDYTFTREPNNALLLTVTGELRWTNIETGVRRPVVTTGKRGLKLFALSADNRVLVTATESDQTLRVWDLPQEPVQWAAKDILSGDFFATDPKRPRLWYVNREGHAQTVDLTTGQQTPEGKIQLGNTMNLYGQPMQGRFATLLSTGIDTGSYHLAFYERHDEWRQIRFVPVPNMTTGALSPDGRHLLVAQTLVGARRTLMPNAAPAATASQLTLFDMATGLAGSTWQVPDYLSFVAFAPDGQSCWAFGEQTHWFDMAGKTRPHTLPVYRNVAWSTDQRYLLVLQDNTFIILDPNTGQIQQRLTNKQQARLQIGRVSGDYAFLRANDPMLTEVWHHPTGRYLGDLRSQTRQSQFHVDPTAKVIYGMGDALERFRLPDLEPLGQPWGKGSRRRLTFFADGRLTACHEDVRGLLVHQVARNPEEPEQLIPALNLLTGRALDADGHMRWLSRTEWYDLRAQLHP